MARLRAKNRNIDFDIRQIVSVPVKISFMAKNPQKLDFAWINMRIDPIKLQMVGFLKQFIIPVFF